MRKLMLLLLLPLLLLAWGCSDSDDPVDPNGGNDPATPAEQAVADSTASAAMGILMDDMEEVMGEEVDPDDIDAMMDMEMDLYVTYLEAALAIDPDCSSAHFGLAFVKTVIMAQDQDLADAMDDLAEEFGDIDVELPLGMNVTGMGTRSLLEGGLLGRSFEILNRAPLALSPQELRLAYPDADKAEVPLISQLQTVIVNKILPATAEILDHLEDAEADPDFQILIEDEDTDDVYDFDLGEVYVLDAVVRALRSGLFVAVAYNVDPAPTGNYNWLQGAMGVDGYTDYEVVTGTAAGDTLYIYDDEEVEVEQMDLFYSGVEDLLTPGSAFLKLWTNPWSGENAMESAYNETNTMLGKLEAAYEFISDEGDTQDDDIITQMLINELDAAILEIGGDIPAWIGTFETIPDIIAWVEEILSGPYTIVLGEGDEAPTLVVDISALFLDPVVDWKTKLPYMRIMDVEEWAEYDEQWVSGPYFNDPSIPFTFTVMGEQVTATNITRYYYIHDDWDMNMPFEFLDGPGGDATEDFPYFPDYTLGGLFPDMDRDGWMTLLGF